MQTMDLGRHRTKMERREDLL